MNGSVLHLPHCRVVFLGLSFFCITGYHTSHNLQPTWPGQPSAGQVHQSSGVQQAMCVMDACGIWVWVYSSYGVAYGWTGV